MGPVARRALAVLAAGLLPLAAACTKSGGTTAPPTGNGGVVATPTTTSGATTPPAATVDGTWTGTWTRTSSPPGSGTMTVVLHQQSQSITGTVDVQASACLTTGQVTGSASGNKITLSATTPAVSGGPDATGSYQGTLNGDKLSGTAVVTCAVGTGTADWALTRQ